MGEEDFDTVSKNRWSVGDEVIMEYSQNWSGGGEIYIVTNLSKNNSSVRVVVFPSKGGSGGFPLWG